MPVTIKTNGMAFKDANGNYKQFDAIKGDTLPNGGQKGQALIKKTNDNGDVEWGTIEASNIFYGDGTDSGRVAIDADTLGGKTIIAILSAVYPIGSLYTTTSNMSPSDIMGFGTWNKVASKMPVGENVFGNGKALGLHSRYSSGEAFLGCLAGGTYENVRTPIGANVNTNLENSGCIANNAVGVPTKELLGDNPEYSGLITDSITVNVWQRVS